MPYLRSLVCLLCICTSISTRADIDYNATTTKYRPNEEIQLPNIGTIASSALPINKEIKLGQVYMGLLENHRPIIHDPLLNYYINNLGQLLVSHAENVHTSFHFFLINSDQMNAFAFFGGYVALYTKLILTTDSENELASVLAHEISHVTQRHIARQIAQQKKETPLTIAALLGSVLVASATGTPVVGAAAFSSTAALSLQSQINFTRANEIEADRIGMQTLERAGFNISGMVNFMQKLLDRYRYSTHLPPLLLTHPLPASRVTEAQTRLQQYTIYKRTSSLDYYLAKARIKTRYTSGSTTTKLKELHHQYQSTKNSPLLRQANAYALALIYLEEKNLVKAHQYLDPLLGKAPLNLFYLDTQTDLLLAENKISLAIKKLRHALNLSVDNPILETNLAQAYLSNKQYKQALLTLEKLTYRNPQDMVAWQLLERTGAKMQDPVLKLKGRAEQQVLKGQWDNALNNYVKASQLAPLGSNTQEMIDARIDQIRKEKLVIETLLHN